MTAYRGHLTTVVGDGPEVVIKLSGDSVRVLTPDGRVHTWPSRDVRVTGISGDRFWLAFQGEIAVFAPENPESFMLEFLPGLKAARTVADAIEAAQGQQPDESEVDDSLSTTGTARVAAYRAKLPQLSDHVAANGHASVELDPETGDEPESTERRWWTRADAGASTPSEPVAAEDEPSPDDEVVVDLTDRSLGATLTAAVARAEHHDEPPPERGAGGEDDASPPPAKSSLLRSLADRNQAFEAGRRGTYKPRR